MRVLLAALLLVSATAIPARGQTYYSPPPQNTRSLGILGGLAGAGIGAAVGEDGGDAVPGALIGGAIGALSGSMVGSSIDQEQTRQRAYRQIQQQQYVNSVTTSDIVQMSQAGLADEVIITQIQSRGLRTSLRTADLIALKQQGVSDRVLQAMQQISAAPPVVHTSPPRVIIRERYYPRYHSHWHHPHWHHRPAPPRGNYFHLHMGH